jgi:hypothetical protein
MRGRISIISWLLLAFYFLTTLVVAQSPNSGKSANVIQSFGSVSGYVSCGDTNAPARFARVELKAIADHAEPRKNNPIQAGRGPAAAVVTASLTRLDGRFLFPGVRPGRYVVIVDLYGYLETGSPISKGELGAPSEANPEADPDLFPIVSVEAGRSSNIDVHLERGSAIGGIVRWDDGSPAVHIPIRVLRRERVGPNQSGKIGIGGGQQPEEKKSDTTDDRGRFRIAGLASGNYIVEASLQTDPFAFGNESSQARYMMGTSFGDLHVYGGNTLKLKEASLIDLGSGDDRDDADITVPLNSIYSLTGEISATSDGHPINMARVILLDGDNRAQLRASEVGDGGSFRFDYVPAGNYLIRVENAADGEMRSHPIVTPSRVIPNEIFEKTHSYAEVEQPINVQHDVLNISILVPDAAVNGAR